ncbi:hypothetical protein [Stenotrophomonas mori]|uniref:Uncharacterized protein n=1 Tax=Stenotrophomonas mori TaxID=2871096 RepID=A0ABT0SKN4_9GAMM|nr:hypothetical protein [Stenotrophomonas mori]MCL7715876.1 hypothetical protein [Stenotrophomonas mori]
MLAGAAPAQEVLPAQAPPDATADGVTTLDEVRALKPEDDQPLDLYRFRNPVKVESNRFSGSWSEPPTPEQVSQSGGYLLMGLNYGLMAAGKGLHRLSGGREQIQAATARPPPELEADQQRRARRYCQADADDCAVPPQD